jgi:hypothetical protein
MSENASTVRYVTVEGFTRPTPARTKSKMGGLLRSKPVKVLGAVAVVGIAGALLGLERSAQSGHKESIIADSVRGVTALEGVAVLGVLIWKELKRENPDDAGHLL